MKREFCLYKRADKKVWYYSTYINEKRVFRSTGCKTKAEALEYCINLLSNDKLHNQNSKRLTFEKFAKGFFDENSEYLKDKKITISTTKSYKMYLEKRLLPYFGKYSLKEISPSLIKSWLLSIEDCNISTKKNFLSVLRIILQEACFKELITSNPCLFVKQIKAEKKEKAVFTLQEIKKLFSSEWKNNKIKLMCKISALTGMRRGEIKALTLDKIKKYYIIVDSNFEERVKKIKGTKSGKKRYAPITQELYNEIILFANERKGFIFNGNTLNTKKIPISSFIIFKCLREQLKKLGIYKKGLSFHSFRHFFNTQLIINGINSEVVRKVVGHESENMTEYYLHISQDDLEKIREVQNRLI